MQEELIKEEEELAKKKESTGVEEAVALKEMTIPTARLAQEQARERAVDEQEKLCQLSRALAVLASASSVSKEREEFLRLVNKEVGAMLQDLEKEIDDVDAKIGDHWRILDRDYDGKVTPEEVASAAMYLKGTLDKEGARELVSSLSKDADGKILVEDIVRLGSRVEDGSKAESE